MRAPDGPSRPRLASLAGASALAFAMAFSAGAADDPPAPASLVEQGRRMYMEGILPSGQPMTAVRQAGVVVSGRQAACLDCHRRSGLGGVEGNIQVPPITGRALHAGKALRDRVVVSLDPRRGRSWNQSHLPYTEGALLAAMRDGVHVSGREMLALMPRYPLSLAELAALEAYLDQLSTDWSPGVTQDSVRLATVITPGVSAQRRRAFLDTLQGGMDQKNSNTLPGHRHMINAAEMVMRLERNWILDIWELTGPADTWPQQLEARYRANPVFAIVSGLSDGDWAPVQSFCERERVPCWFPSVPVVPASADHEFYGLYFQRGTTLEADVLARHLLDGPGKALRVVEVLRESLAARAAADLLRARIGTKVVEERIVDAPGAAGLREVIDGLPHDATVVLWLGPDDVAALNGIDPPAGPVYASTRLATGLKPAFPTAWAQRVHLVYPYELPPMRDLNLATFHSWLAVRGLPLVDEAMQEEVYCATTYLQFTLSDMLDNVYRDYLIDRGESMLVRHQLGRAEEETMIRQQGHPPARSVAAQSTLAPGAIYGSDPEGQFAQKNTPALFVRQGTSIYPRLGLAQGQRFASKGAYIVHYAADGALVADGDWIVP